MSGWLSEIRPYLELVYYASILTLAVVGLIGLRQILLVKYDIKTTNLRAANKEAVILIDRYLEKYVAINNQHTRQMKKDNVPCFKGKLGDFSSIQEAELQRAVERIKKGKYWIPMLNQLEIIAAGVNSGLANDKLSFFAFGKSFCNTVEENYDVICSLHSGGTVKYYSNIVDLYQRWHTRIKRAQLERRKAEVDEQLRKTIDQKVQAIGTDLK